MPGRQRYIFPARKRAKNRVAILRQGTQARPDTDQFGLCERGYQLQRPVEQSGNCPCCVAFVEACPLSRCTNINRLIDFWYKIDLIQKDRMLERHTRLTQ